jgi:F0F1-type ATP synthase epsilon subunit
MADTPVCEEVAAIRVPAANGCQGILPGHASLLADPGTGFLNCDAGGKR